MLFPILALVAVLIIGFLVFVITRPATFRYTRSLAIAAPAADLFAQVNDLKKFQEWNPWAKVDPQCEIVYSGPPTGVGSSYAWKGNRAVGEGRMTITESRPHELVRARLEFIKPFAATNTAEFSFTPAGGRTIVTWGMSGENKCISKLMGVFIDFDKMVGSQFERGLETLKSLSEQPR